MIVFLIPIIGALCISFLIFSFLKGRHAERMSIIEKGVIDADLNFGEPAKWMVLRAGMLMIGLGIGVSIGSALNLDMFNGAVIGGLSLFFGGLALIINFIIENKLRK